MTRQLEFEKGPDGAFVDAGSGPRFDGSDYFVRIERPFYFFGIAIDLTAEATDQAAGAVDALGHQLRQAKADRTAARRSQPPRKRGKKVIA